MAAPSNYGNTVMRSVPDPSGLRMRVISINRAAKVVRVAVASPSPLRRGRRCTGRAGLGYGKGGMLLPSRRAPKKPRRTCSTWPWPQQSSPDHRHQLRRSHDAEAWHYAYAGGAARVILESRHPRCVAQVARLELDQRGTPRSTAYVVAAPHEAAAASSLPKTSSQGRAQGLQRAQKQMTAGDPLMRTDTNHDGFTITVRQALGDRQQALEPAPCVRSACARSATPTCCPIGRRSVACSPVFRTSSRSRKMRQPTRRL